MTKKPPSRALAEQKIQEAQVLQDLSHRAIHSIDTHDPDIVRKVREALALQNASVDAASRAIEKADGATAAETTNEKKRQRFAKRHSDVRAFHTERITEGLTSAAATGKTAAHFNLSKSQVSKIIRSN